MKRKAFDDISTRPTKIVRSELQCVDDENLEEKDLKNYNNGNLQERTYQSLQLNPNLGENVHDALDAMELEN